MVAFPGCKVNLGLHILGKRPDGYHSLQTCYVPLPWTDILEIIPSSKLEFTLTGLPIAGSPEDNLCFRAYRLIQSEFQLPPIHLHLHKLVPMGAGLGGGSADASHTLRLLNTLFELAISKDRLITFAQKLGSDCAFFCQDEIALGSGRGEILKSVNVPSLKGHFMTVVTPAFGVSTAEAYAGVVPRQHTLDVEAVIQSPLDQWRGRLVNDFESSVFVKYPELAKIKATLDALGALYSSLSGSGSSVYGIFKKEFARAQHFGKMAGWSGWL